MMDVDTSMPSSSSGGAATTATAAAFNPMELLAKAAVAKVTAESVNSTAQQQVGPFKVPKTPDHAPPDWHNRFQNTAAVSGSSSGVTAKAEPNYQQAPQQYATYSMPGSSSSGNGGSSVQQNANSGNDSDAEYDAAYELGQEQQGDNWSNLSAAQKQDIVNSIIEAQRRS
jgi:hypothetical protein